jgi:hypothetical protein
MLQVWRCWQTLSLRPSRELNSANLLRRSGLGRMTGRTWISNVSDYVVGSTLDGTIFFGFVIWNLEENLRRLFVSLDLLYCIWKALGPQGSVDKGFCPEAYGPHWPHLPPPASPAPMRRRMASPRSDARHWSPEVRLWFPISALSFAIYIRGCFSLFAL